MEIKCPLCRKKYENFDAYLRHLRRDHPKLLKKIEQLNTGLTILSIILALIMIYSVRVEPLVVKAPVFIISIIAIISGVNSIIKRIQK